MAQPSRALGAWRGLPNKEGELAPLLKDLRRIQALITPAELEHRAPSPVPTGLDALDRLLGGGLPEGRIVRLGAAKGTFASALGLRVLSECTVSGRNVALIDRADAFDPRGAAEAGAELERLLWCRPATDRAAIRAADALLASAAFPLVILDLGREERGRGRREQPISSGAWQRLARGAEAARACLIVVGGEVAAGVSAATLSAVQSRARFRGQGPGRIFEGLELTVSLERNRLGLPPGEIRLSFQAPSHFGGDP